jgi:hypothetical protein
MKGLARESSSITANTQREPGTSSGYPVPRAGEIGKGVETERFHSLWSMVRWKGEIARPRLLLGVIGLLEDALGRLTEFHTS